MKETIREWKCNGERRGGAEGGFIDDVVAGERLVVKRTAKDLSYQALRYCSTDSFVQRSQGNQQGKEEADTKELLPVRLLPVRQSSSMKEMIEDIEEEEEEAVGDPCWAISRASS